MKKLHNILILLILVNMPSSAWAVTVGPYSGRVVDEQTGEPVVGASVLMYWEKRVIYPMGSRSELMGVKLVYTDDKGNYTMPQVADVIEVKGYLANTNIITYQPGYEANIKRAEHDNPYKEPDQDIKTKDNLIKLQRIPPKFDHRKHRDSIEDALRGLDYASEYLDKDAMTGSPINVSSKVLALIDSSQKLPNEFLARTRWEERRCSGENMATALGEYCDIHDFSSRTFIVPDESTWEPKSRTQYVRCIDAALKELKNRDPWIRLDAVYKLGEIKARRAIPSILVLFKDKSDWRQKYVQQECVLSISKMAPESNKKISVGSGPVVVSPEVVSSDGRVIRKATSTVIEKEVKRIIVPVVPEENRAQVITAFLENIDDQYLRKEIIKILGRMHAIEAEKLVKEAIQDPDEEIRAVAVTAFSSIFRAASGKENDSGAKQVSNDGLDPFMKALKEPSANVRLNAIYALGNFDTPAVVDALIAALSDNDYRIKSQAIKKLSTHNDIRIL